MPNHVHALFSLINTTQSINTIIGNGKRFMAYEIINCLEKNNETTLLEQLAGTVEATRKENKKQHDVWELYFLPITIGRKDCRSNEFVWQKLDYMHNNPWAGKWQLVVNAIEYIHSRSARHLSSYQLYGDGRSGFQ